MKREYDGTQFTARNKEGTNYHLLQTVCRQVLKTRAHITRCGVQKCENSPYLNTASFPM